jgi:hypothetical protein
MVASASTLATCAQNFAFAGVEPARSLQLVKRALRMSPFYPDWYLVVAMQANWLAGNPQAAMAHARELERRRPQWVGISNGYMAVMHVEAGDLDGARLEVAKIRERMPEATATEIAYGPYMGGGFKDEAVQVHIIEALYTAGLPK